MSMDKGIDLEEQYDKIYRYCYFKLQHRELAEDITQETFLHFLESSGYRETGKALRYLYTIARNLCMDEFRRPAAVLLQEEEQAESIMRNRNEEEALLHKVSLQKALGQLEAEERELLLLRYVNQVPVSVICGLFGISRFAVYRRINGALKQLREEMGEEDFT